MPLDDRAWLAFLAEVRQFVAGDRTERLAAAPNSAIANAPPPLPDKPSIAVMPFANLSGDPEQDYFVDGMVIEVVEALSRIRSIFVIGGGSTLSLKGKSASPQDVGRQFGVRYVLEGSVRKAGGRVRIGVQLTDAADGMQIWTHRFEETLDDIFVSKTVWHSASRARSNLRWSRRKFAARLRALPRV